MFDVFGEVKKHITTSGNLKPEIRSTVFWALKFGMLVCIGSCVLVTAKNYIGDNINCITGFDKQEHKAIETYCFISSTFSVLDLSNNQTPHPGIGPVKYPLKDMTVEEYMESQKKLEEEKKEKEPDATERYHSYYQWVPIVLALQAAIYYAPIWFWSQVERGYFDMILCGLNNISLDGAEKSKLKASGKHFFNTLNHHNGYAIKFFLCEIIGMTIAIGNIFFTNVFLGGEFLNFGPNALKYLNTPAYDPSNPLNEIFPKVAKCTWHKFGPSGTIQRYDSMCVLPLNIVNEKTYILLWLSYITISVVISVTVLYHLLLIILPGPRAALLKHNIRNNQTKTQLDGILRHANYGDWFLLYYLKLNMAYYQEWVATVSNYVNGTSEKMG